MITAFLITHLLFFPSPITRDPSRPQEIALTQWGESWLGVAHNNKAGAAFYEAGSLPKFAEVRVLKDNIWVQYQVVESGIYLCETPHPNCNDETFRRMYEPDAVILATCWPREGETRGQFIIKILPTLDSVHDINYDSVHETSTQQTSQKTNRDRRTV